MEKEYFAPSYKLCIELMTKYKHVEAGLLCRKLALASKKEREERKEKQRKRRAGLTNEQENETEERNDENMIERDTPQVDSPSLSNEDGSHTSMKQHHRGAGSGSTGLLLSSSSVLTSGLDKGFEWAKNISTEITNSLQSAFKTTLSPAQEEELLAHALWSSTSSDVEETLSLWKTHGYEGLKGLSQRVAQLQSREKENSNNRNHHSSSSLTLASADLSLQLESIRIGDVIEEVFSSAAEQERLRTERHVVSSKLSSVKDITLAAKKNVKQLLSLFRRGSSSSEKESQREREQHANNGEGRSNGYEGENESLIDVASLTTGTDFHSLFWSTPSLPSSSSSLSLSSSPSHHHSLALNQRKLLSYALSGELAHPNGVNIDPLLHDLALACSRKQADLQLAYLLSMHDPLVAFRTMCMLLDVEPDLWSMGESDTSKQRSGKFELREKSENGRDQQEGNTLEAIQTALRFTLLFSCRSLLSLSPRDNDAQAAAYAELCADKDVFDHISSVVSSYGSGGLNQIPMELVCQTIVLVGNRLQSSPILALGSPSFSPSDIRAFSSSSSTVKAETEEVVAAGDEEEREIDTSSTAASISYNKPVHPAVYYGSIFKSVWDKSQKAKFVLSVCPDVDIVRFSSDSAYRLRTTLDLTQTSDPQKMEVAKSLCLKYGIPLFEIYAERAVWLFEHVNDTPSLSGYLLQYQPTLLEKPDSFDSVLSTRIYDAIDGTDYPRLRFYFSLREECKKERECIAEKKKKKQTTKKKKKRLSLSLSSVEKSIFETHVQVLDRLEKADIHLNYKDLLDPATCVDVLTATVDEQNVYVVARLAQRIEDLMAPTPSVSKKKKKKKKKKEDEDEDDDEDEEEEEKESEELDPFLSSSSPSLSSSLVFEMYLGVSLRTCMSTGKSISSWFRSESSLIQKLKLTDLADLLWRTSPTYLNEDEQKDLDLMTWTSKRIDALEVGTRVLRESIENEEREEAKEMKDGQASIGSRDRNKRLLNTCVTMKYYLVSLSLLLRLETTQEEDESENRETRDQRKRDSFSWSRLLSGDRPNFVGIWNTLLNLVSSLSISSSDLDSMLAVLSEARMKWIKEYKGNLSKTEVNTSKMWKERNEETEISIIQNEWTNERVIRAVVKEWVHSFSSPPLGPSFLSSLLLHFHSLLSHSFMDGLVSFVLSICSVESGTAIESATPELPPFSCVSLLENLWSLLSLPPGTVTSSECFSLLVDRLDPLRNALLLSHCRLITERFKLYHHFDISASLNERKSVAPHSAFTLSQVSGSLSESLPLVWQSVFPSLSPSEFFSQGITALRMRDENTAVERTCERVADLSCGFASLIEIFVRVQAEFTAYRTGGRIDEEKKERSVDQQDSDSVFSRCSSFMWNDDDSSHHSLSPSDTKVVSDCSLQLLSFLLRIRSSLSLYIQSNATSKVKTTPLRAKVMLDQHILSIFGGYACETLSLDQQQSLLDSMVHVDVALAIKCSLLSSFTQIRVCAINTLRLLCGASPLLGDQPLSFSFSPLVEPKVRTGGVDPTASNWTESFTQSSSALHHLENDSTLHSLLIASASFPYLTDTSWGQYAVGCSLKNHFEAMSEMKNVRSSISDTDSLFSWTSLIHLIESPYRLQVQTTSSSPSLSAISTSDSSSRDRFTCRRLVVSLSRYSETGSFCRIMSGCGSYFSSEAASQIPSLVAVARSSVTSVAYVVGILSTHQQFYAASSTLLRSTRTHTSMLNAGEGHLRKILHKYFEFVQSRCGSTSISLQSAVHLLVSLQLRCTSPLFAALVSELVE